MNQRPPIELGELRALVTSLERLIAEATRAATDLKAAIAAAEAYSDGPPNPGHHEPPRPAATGLGAVEAAPERRSTGARKAGPTPWSRRKPVTRTLARPEPQRAETSVRMSAPPGPNAEPSMAPPPPVTRQPPPRTSPPIAAPPVPQPTAPPPVPPVTALHADRDASGPTTPESTGPTHETPQPTALPPEHDTSGPTTAEDTGPTVRPQAAPSAVASLRPTPAGPRQETPRPQPAAPATEIPRPRTDIRGSEPAQPRAGTDAGGTRRPEEGPVHRIAVEMGARHGVEIVGFEETSVETDVVREIAAAVDDLLAKYPIALHGIELTAANGNGPPRAERRASSAIPRAGSETIWLVLDRAAFTPSDRPDGNSLPRKWLRRDRDADRAVYTAVVREYGRALEVAGNFRARQEAQRLLITESLHAGRGLTFSPLDPGRALLDAFTEVELRGDRAGKLAKALHDILVKMTRPESTDVPA